MLTRVCKQCGIDKPLTEFHESKVHKHGRKPICAECYNWNHRSEESKQKELELMSLTEQGFKRCPHCKIIKTVDEYASDIKRKDGFRAYCKECEQQINLERSRTPEFLVTKQEYELSPQYFKKLKMRYQRKMITDINFKTGLYLRNLLYNALQKQEAEKYCSFMKLIGCTPNELNKYIEHQFTEGMSWNNHERRGWHIDHIIPVSAFDLKNSIHQRACFFWKNLRPMWGRPNIQKGGKYNQTDFETYMSWFMDNVENKIA